MADLQKSGSEGEAQRRFAYSDYLELMSMLLSVLMVITIAIFIREVVGGAIDRHSLILLIYCTMLATGVNLYWHTNTGEELSI